MKLLKYEIEKNGKKKTVHIPDNILDRYQKEYEISQDKAIQLYLEDEDILTNEEIEKLTKQAKKNGLTGKINKASSINKSLEKKPRTVKTSDEKKELFQFLLDSLKGYDISILTENKLIQVKIGEKTFKLDLIEQRQKK